MTPQLIAEEEWDNYHRDADISELSTSINSESDKNLSVQDTRIYENKLIKFMLTNARSLPPKISIILTSIPSPLR